MGILQKYGVKAEITFPQTRECRRAFLKRVEELCRQRVRRDGVAFWEDSDSGVENVFRYDEELTRCVDEAVKLEVENRGVWGGEVVELRYDVGFSM